MPTNAIESTVSSIENARDRAPSSVLAEANALRQADAGNPSALGGDLASVTAQLHNDGVLPRVDLVMDGNGSDSLRYTSGGINANGEQQLVSNVDGKHFTYNQEGQITQISEDNGKDVWNYNSQDGKYYESVDNKATGKSMSDGFYTTANGSEVQVHNDGSETVTNASGTQDFNNSGELTKEVLNNGSVRTMQYNQNGQLESINEYANAQDAAGGKDSQSYNFDPQTGKFFSSKDSNHSDPLDVSIGNNPTDYGSINITHQDGSFEQQRESGADLKWNPNGQLTDVTYANGNKAGDFTYDNSGELTGFKTTAFNGDTQTFSANDGTVTVNTDGQTQQYQGSLRADQYGQVQMVQPDGNGGYQTTTLRLNGAEVTADGDNVTRVVDTKGNVNNYNYTDGQLTGVSAYGHQLQLSPEGQWLNADGTPAATPSLDQYGNLTMTNSDGSFTETRTNGYNIAGTSSGSPINSSSSWYGAPGQYYGQPSDVPPSA